MKVLTILCAVLIPNSVQAACLPPLGLVDSAPPVTYDANFDTLGTCTLLHGSMLRAPLHSGTISSATTAIDYSTTHATCTATGTPPTFDTDGVSLNGTNDSVNCGDEENFSFGDGVNDFPFSASFWFRAATNAVLEVINKEASIGSLYEWRILVNTSISIQVTTLDESFVGFIGRRSSGVSLPLNTWHNVVITYNGGKTSASFLIYLNGVVVGAYTALGAGSYTAMENSTGPLNIGTFNGGFFAADLVGMNLWDRVLSADEVTNIFNLGRPTDG